MILGPQLDDGGSWHGKDAVVTPGQWHLPTAPGQADNYDARDTAGLAPVFQPTPAPASPSASDNLSLIAEGMSDPDGMMAYQRKYGSEAALATGLRYLSFDVGFIPFVGAGSIGLDMWANTIEGKPAISEEDAPYIAMSVMPGIGSIGKIGKLGKVGSVAARTGEKVADVATHGNSASSPARSYLYRLYDSEGGYLKTGISKNPLSRYGKSFMDDKQMEILQSGTRREMLNLERFIVERDPGPLNRERWAGTFRSDIP